MEPNVWSNKSNLKQQNTNQIVRHKPEKVMIIMRRSSQNGK